MSREEKIDKLSSNSKVHFGIILGLTQGVQSHIGHSIFLKKREENTIQQTSMAIMEVLSAQGPVKDKQQTKKGHSGHVFS